MGGSSASPLATIGLAVGAAALTVATGGTGLPVLLAAGGELAGGAVSAYGGMQEASAEKAAGKAQQQEANYEAVEYKQKANQDAAAAERKSIEIGRQGDLVESTAVARAAASGGSVNDPTIMGIIGTLEGQKTYQQNTAIYDGKVASQDDNTAAANKIWEGNNAAAAGRTQAQATGLKTIGGAIQSGTSLYSRYGAGTTTAADGQDAEGFTDGNGIKFGAYKGFS